MNSRHLENRLALLGALVVLMGVLAAANSAFAGETLTVPQDKAIERDAAAETISGAREAITESARKAAEALEAENLFYLENKLADITSTLIVSNT